MRMGNTDGDTLLWDALLGLGWRKEGAVSQQIFYFSEIKSKKSAAILNRYPQDIQQNEHQHAGQATDPADDDRSKAVAEVGFPEPRHNPERV